jgi:hypothetical protein
MKNTKIYIPSRNNLFCVENVIRKVRILVARYYKYPYPEERYFKELSEKSICDAHGTTINEVFTKNDIRRLCFHLKKRALEYIISVQEELKAKQINPAQVEFFAYKINTSVANMNEKLEKLNLQFSDRDDIKNLNFASA